MKTITKSTPGQPLHIVTSHSEGSITSTAHIYASKEVKGGVAYESFRVSYYVAGQRQRRRHNNLNDAKRDAERIVRQLCQGELEALKFSGRERTEMQLATETLAGIGVSLPEAALLVRDCAKLVGVDRILDAVKHWVAQGVGQLTPKTVAEAIHDLVTAKEQDGRSEFRVKELRLRLGRFATKFTGQIVEVRHDEVQAWLRSLKRDDGGDLAARTRNHYAEAVTTLFGFARSAGYLPKASTVGTELPRATGKKAIEADHEPVEIYTPDEATRILRKLQVFRPELVPMMAICAFAGARTEEAERLMWTEVNFTTRKVRLPGNKTKTGKPRNVDMPQNLIEWLRPYQGSVGKVAPLKRTQKTIQKIIETARIDAEGRTWGPLPWKHNAWRHSYGSYSLTVVGDPGKVSFQMGNFKDVMLAHYHELTDRQSADAYFAIVPGETSIATVTSIAAVPAA